MSRIKVESGEYKICDTKMDQSLYTVNLDRDIAFTLYSITLQKVALARNLTDQQCIQLFKEINKNNLPDTGRIDCMMIGGDNSAKARKYFAHIVNVLNRIDNTDNIVLVLVSVLHSRHPNSFEIHCFDGRIYEI
ncbi:hypothetical protein I4U23_022043 [Adineta vaga]|nr:hypothetical protein I4U23_022043 [Adineta vaga]